MLDYLLLLADLIRAALRSRRELVAENLILRQQLAVLTRPTRKRARLRAHDKLVWVLAGRLVDGWRRHLVLVRPEAVVARHRRGWRLFWRWRSRCPLGRPRLSAEVRADRHHHPRQPHPGRRAHPGRAPQARDRREPALGATAPARRSGAPAEPELADVRPQPPAGRLGCGLVGGPDPDPPDAV